MKQIYTHFSNSHEIFYTQYFKPSIRRLYTKDELGIKVAKHEQYSPTGSFMEQGWRQTMLYKIQTIRTAITENWNSWFIFSDCDIQYFNHFVEDIAQRLDGIDIVAQDDCGSLCAGFFGCRCNDTTKKLFDTISTNFNDYANDQVALNLLKYTFTYALLPKEKYYTIGNYFDNIDGTHVWDNKTYITIPNKSIKMHHGNYVVGVENKLKLMEMIKTQYNDSSNKFNLCDISPTQLVTSDVQDKYNELLLAVVRCFPNESRHETALRYIREKEARKSESGCVSIKKD